MAGSGLTPDKLDADNDYAFDCPHRKCTAKVGQQCDGLPPNVVHFARRLRRLLTQQSAGRTRPY